MSDGWRVEAREAPAALAETFEPERFVGTEPLRTRTEWVTLAEKLDAEGMALLMRAVL